VLSGVKNPAEKLEELRRSSLVELEHLVLPTPRKIPLRSLPETAADDESSQGQKPPIEPSSSDSVSDFELEKGATAANAAKLTNQPTDVSPTILPDRGLGRSPGSFSAESAGLLDETGTSPMER
jgi:glycogenin